MSFGDTYRHTVLQGYPHITGTLAQVTLIDS